MAVFRVERNKGYALLTLETGEKIRHLADFLCNGREPGANRSSGLCVHHQSAD